MSNNSSNNSEKLRADLLNFGPDVAEKGLVGVVEVPAREVRFVEQAYRSSLFWLACTGLLTLGLVGFRFIG